jgi:tRNA/tmRNA/rRNA uracil-C5-methylase (TrmA/RlmC/RlmD family)
LELWSTKWAVSTLSPSQEIESQTMQIEITDLAYGGNGVGHSSDGRVVFVPFTAPGDVVDVEITREHERYLEGRVTEIVTPSADRCEPRCPHFGRCGGCQYQHLNYAAQLDAKKRQLAQSLKHLAGLRELPEINPVAGSLRHYGYRNKLTLESLPESDPQQPEFGFCELDNQTFFPLDECPLASAELNRLIGLAHKHPKARKVVKVKKRPRLVLRQPAEGKPRFYFGKPSHQEPWFHEELCGRPVSVPPGSFWQVNPNVAETLMSTISAWLDQAPGQRFIDAYAGVGAFSLVAGERFAQHVLIERDRSAVKAAETNHRDWGIANPTCICDSTERALPKLLAGSLEQERLGTTLLLDPPRSGCDKRVIQALVDHPVCNLIYVSCNPATLARDLGKLCGEEPGQYAIQRLALFDMFPQTAHFESAVALTLNK